MNAAVRAYLASIGAKGGAVASEAQKAAARENEKKGGRAQGSPLASKAGTKLEHGASPRARISIIMKKRSNKESGTSGEQEIVDVVPCPNCGKKLMKLPPNYPLYDVQCTGCSFRAQVKTNLSRPKSIVLGAGWQIMNKVLKSGFMTPPLFLNLKWIERGSPRQEIRFYPFVPKKNLSNYRLSKTARRANYEMFTYTSMDKLPHFLVYSK